MAQYFHFPDFQTVEDCERRVKMDRFLVDFVRAWPEPDESRILMLTERITELERRAIELQFEG